jgi:hypothetical protein
LIFQLFCGAEIDENTWFGGEVIPIHDGGFARDGVQ